MALRLLRLVGGKKGQGATTRSADRCFEKPEDRPAAMDRYTLVFSSLPFLPSLEYDLAISFEENSSGAEHEGSAPEPKKAPLRSSHWSGRPNNHLVPARLAPLPRRVGSAGFPAKVQHAAELGYLRSVIAGPKRNRIYSPSRPARFHVHI
jgi:hypothetical protein